MSFILDALRKSDAERQRAATPGLADVRYARRPSRRNIWLPLLVVVLLVNIGFMGVQWFNRQNPAPSPAAGDDSSTMGQVVHDQAADDRAPAPSTAASGPPAAAIRPLARENEFAELRPPYTPEPELPVAPPPVRVTAEAPPAAGIAPLPDTTMLAATPAVRPDPFPRITPTDTPPPMEQLIGAGKLDVPMLNLDLHVYSNQPAKRFVMINSHKYREGDRLAEGPLVESITTDGAILSSQGQRFTLARK